MIAEQQPQQRFTNLFWAEACVWRELHLVDHAIPSCCYDGVHSFLSQSLQYVSLTVLCFVGDSDLDPVSLLPASDALKLLIYLEKTPQV